MDMLIVYNNRNNRLVDFELSSDGEIVLLSTDPKNNVDTCNVLMINSKYIDMEEGTFFKEKYNAKKTG